MLRKIFSLMFCRREGPREPSKNHLKVVQENQEKSKIIRKSLRKQLLNQEIELNLKIAEIDEEIEKNQKDLKKLKEKSEMEKAPHDNLLSKIKTGRIISLKNNKVIFQENKAKIKSLLNSLDCYFNNFKLAKSRNLQADIMRQVSDISRSDELRKSMLDLQKDLEEIGIVSEIVDQTFKEANDYKGENSQSLLKSEIEELEESLYKKTKLE